MRAPLCLLLAACLLAGCSAGPQVGDVAPPGARVPNSNPDADPDAVYQPTARERLWDRVETAGYGAYHAAETAVSAAAVAPVALLFWLLPFPLPFGK